MTKMRIRYRGGFSTEIIHESKAHFVTDAPKESGGKGEAFSPTDLFAASLASCMLTVMAIAAQKIAFNLEGTEVEVEKEMVQDPHRRVRRILVRIRSPHTPNEPARKKLEEAALHCPVHFSIDPKVIRDIDFIWGV